MLWLPTIQKCEKGEHRWIEIPPSVEEWDDLEEPAPYIKVAIGQEDNGDANAPPQRPPATRLPIP